MNILNYFLLAFLNFSSTGDKIYINSHQDIYKNILFNYCDNLEEEEDHIFLESIVSVTDNLPNSVNDIQINILGEKDIFKLSKKNKKIKLVRIIPLRMKKGRLYATLLVFDVECHKKMLKYTNRGGFSVEIDKDENDNFFMIYK